jgi:hypothetical protein
MRFGVVCLITFGILDLSCWRPPTALEPEHWRLTSSPIVPASLAVPDSVRAGESFEVRLTTLVECRHRIGPMRVTHSEPLRFDVAPLDSVLVGGKPYMCLASLPARVPRSILLRADEPGTCRVFIHALGAEGIPNSVGTIERAVVVVAP